jgi:NitT/TauT family transport system substrate-binding protein
VLGVALPAFGREGPMSTQHTRQISRRRFLGGLTHAGMAGLLGWHPRPVAAEPPPETTTLRLEQSAVRSICGAPYYVAEEFLRGEGFTEVQYVQEVGAVGTGKSVASGHADIVMSFSGPLIVRVDAGDPIVMLAGVHVGCYEVVGTDRVRAIRDLKGKTVAVPGLDSAHHLFLASMVAYVGLDPRTDIQWVTHAPSESIQLLAEGKVDALVGFPPVPQELRAKGIGHTVVSSAVDRPWSQYFCCIAVGNQAFVRKYPVATKRVLRAILKATDMCARDPDWAAQLIVEKGHTPNYDYALQTLREIPYNRWREYDPEDTVRFYALRLHEVGMIKSSPQKIIAQGTDWHFFNELKKELKG